MPIHCCAMQGRIDGIQALLAADSDGAIRLALENEPVTGTIFTVLTDL